MPGRIVAFLVVLGALVGALLWSQRAEGPLVVSGFVEAREIRVGSRIGGRVAVVHVEEGQRVSAGDRLLEIEPFDLLERRAEAEGMLGEQQAELARLKSGLRPEEIAQAKARRDQAESRLQRLVSGPREQEIATGRAQVDLAEARLELAGQERERIGKLHAENISSADQLDRAVSAHKVASAEVAVRRQELGLLLEGTRVEDIAVARAELQEADEAWKLSRNGYRAEDIARAEASVAASAAALAAIQRQLDEVVVRSPAEALVEAVELRPGDLIAANAPALSLLDPSELWIRAYVPESRLIIAPEDAVMVRVDSFPQRRFRGRVSFISRQAEFTPGNVQTPEERSKQVFRIKVTLEEGLDVLRPGMAADVWLEQER